MWGIRLAALSLAPILLLGGPVRSQQSAEFEAPDAGAPTEALHRAVAQRMAVNEEAVASQKRVEKLSDEADELLSRYRTALRQIESLRTYNAQMDEMIASQQEELSSLRDQLDQIELVSRDVTPLMLKMIHALDRFVSLDVPFLMGERRGRIEKLHELMKRADVTEAEKFRAIMEAYQIENEYGRTIEAYRSTLSQADKEMTVDFLRIGRIALVYQTLDESQAGVWNQEERRWEPLGESYRTAIRNGLRIARKQAAPDMIRVPLSEPERVVEAF